LPSRKIAHIRKKENRVPSEVVDALVSVLARDREPVFV
jgi:hypothetical protein